MADVYIGKAEFLRRFGEAAYRDHRAAIAARKAKYRAEARVRALGEDAPLDPLLRRNVANCHPEGCECFDCLWGPTPAREPRVARWPERIRL